MLRWVETCPARTVIAIRQRGEVAVALVVMVKLIGKYSAPVETCARISPAVRLLRGAAAPAEGIR